MTTFALAFQPGGQHGLLLSVSVCRNSPCQYEACKDVLTKAAVRKTATSHQQRPSAPTSGECAACNTLPGQSEVRKEAAQRQVSGQPAKMSHCCHARADELNVLQVSTSWFLRRNEWFPLSGFCEANSEMVPAFSAAPRIWPCCAC